MRVVSHVKGDGDGGGGVKGCQPCPRGVSHVQGDGRESGASTIYKVRVFSHVKGDGGGLRVVSHVLGASALFKVMHERDRGASFKVMRGG